MPELIVSYLDGTEERYPLAGQDVFIGRDTQLLVSIPDSKISRRHARVFLRRGAWFIEDLGSVNGVVVDGVRITTAVPFSAGRDFHIGDEILRLVERAPVGAGARGGVAPQSPSPWRLTVTAGPLKGQVLTLLSPGPQIIGRDALADLPLADASMSRKHARLVVGPHDVAVEDLGSSNGTFINEQPTSRGVMRAGDVLRLGSVSLHLRHLPQAALPPERRVAPAQASSSRPVGPPVPKLHVPRPKRPLVWLGVAAILAVVGGGIAYSWHTPSAPVGRTKAVDKKAAKRAERAQQVDGDSDADSEAAQDEAPLPQKATAAPLPEPEPQALTEAHEPEEAQPPSPNASPAPRPQPPTGVRGRLARAWRRAVGFGPSSAERDRDRRVTKLYRQALAQSRSADREGALSTLQELLLMDALHPAGQALQGQLLLREDEANALRKAQTAMQAGQALQALGIVSQALDRPFSAIATDNGAAAAPPSAEAQQLRALGDQAAVQLSQACGERAQAACMAQAWEPCIVQLACLLGYQPQAVQGLALLALAMDAVKAQPSSMAPSGPHTALGQQPMGVAQEALMALSARYPQAALRQAVLVYSTGDIAAASQKLRPLTCAQCRVVGGDVRRVALGLPRAKQLRESGQHDAALALYDEILAADSRLCPPPTPSVLHHLALEGKQAVYLLQGSAAFERGAYQEALSAYLEGIRLGPPNEGLDNAVARLSRRAQDILSSVQTSIGKTGGNAALPRPVCAHLQEVLAMTAPQDSTHKRAQELMARCKAKR